MGTGSSCTCVHTALACTCTRGPGPGQPAGLWPGGRPWGGRTDTASRTCSANSLRHLPATRVRLPGQPSRVPQTERLQQEACGRPQLWGPGVGAPGRTVGLRSLQACVCGGPRFGRMLMLWGWGPPDCNCVARRLLQVFAHIREGERAVQEGGADPVSLQTFSMLSWTLRPGGRTGEDVGRPSHTCTQIADVLL